MLSRCYCVISSRLTASHTFFAILNNNKHDNCMGHSLLRIYQVKPMSRLCSLALISVLNYASSLSTQPSLSQHCFLYRPESLIQTIASWAVIQMELVTLKTTLHFHCELSRNISAHDRVVSFDIKWLKFPSNILSSSYKVVAATQLKTKQNHVVVE